MHALSPRILVWLDPAAIEPQATRQLFNLAALPFVVEHVAVMPDCHVGKGATIGAGSTITKDVPPAELTLSRTRQTTVKGWQRPQKTNKTAGK